jgi:hypothetical protein
MLLYLVLWLGCVTPECMHMVTMLLWAALPISAGLGYFYPRLWW